MRSLSVRPCTIYLCVRSSERLACPSRSLSGHTKYAFTRIHITHLYVRAWIIPWLVRVPRWTARLRAMCTHTHKFIVHTILCGRRDQANTHTHAQHSLRVTGANLYAPLSYHLARKRASSSTCGWAPRQWVSSRVPSVCLCAKDVVYLSRPSRTHNSRMGSSYRPYDRSCYSVENIPGTSRMQTKHNATDVVVSLPSCCCRPSWSTRQSWNVTMKLI